VHNELSEYKKLNLRLQGELCRANADVDNLKQVISKRQNNVEQPKMNFQVNKGNNKITELRAILQRESQNSISI
jgi:hypothetical protein